MSVLHAIGRRGAALFAFAQRLLRRGGAALVGARRSRAALLESEKRLQAVFDQAAVGVALVDMRTGCFERVNQKYCDILGYTRDELQGRSVRDISEASDYQLNLDLRDELQRGRRASFQMEKRQLRKDGSMVWVDLTVAPVLQEGGVPRYNVGVIQDITERRRMQDALRRSEEQLRSILDHLPVGILLSGPDGQAIFHNRHFVDITGYTRRDLVGAGAWWTRAFPDPDVRAQALSRWHAACSQAHAGQIARAEYDVCRADGGICSVALSGIALGHNEILIFEDLSRYKAAEEQINYLAYYDPLTGLANWRLLRDRLDTALSRSVLRKQCGAVLMLDLDRFKLLNEVRGHDCGDQLLRQVAQRLRGQVRTEDVLARHGGDAFVLVLDADRPTPTQAAAHAGELGERVLAALRAPFLLDGESYRTTASIGAAVFQGRAESPDELLRQVDVALYQAKASGRDVLCFYDARAQALVSERAALESDLRVALEQGQLEPYYQAQVCDGRIIGAEILVRWHHPRQGLVPPAAFIPLAEETGLIQPLGEAMLRAACQQLAAWATDPRLAGLTLSVNISPLQFYQDDFVARVLDALADTGADPSLLELELTEGLLLQDVEDTIAKMVRLKARGLRFSLDDFGTGYSSLAYLKRLPLDQLKIDQSFVRDVLRDPNDAAIVRTLVALGSTFGLRVIAEGVETEAQKAFLLAQGCRHWQGYLFSRPVPLGRFTALVRANPASGQGV
ncbi:sensor domain-containing protein [Castellaniella caeni]|uniref:sensor domain-containing protein n=1 Tax=Castellaniella caeni TaxID=266123 RepID=UPI000C9F18A7|nr:GGDEF domain-containing phosphodiesterase [Castellaniella caeni]